VSSTSVRIEYWDRKSWVSYLKNHVLPLYESTFTALNLWVKLRELAHGRLLSDVIREVPSLELVFVGGTSPPDRYEERGLALLYKYLLGTSIKLREYYFLRQHGKEPKTPCVVDRTPVVDYLDHIHALLERVVAHTLELGLLTQDDVRRVQESSAKAVKQTLARPERVSEIFVELLNRALNMTVAYNEYTRFIWHLRKIPKKYMKEFYPELLKPEVFEFIQKLLGLREYIIPQVEDPEIADLYTIYSFDYATEASGNWRIDGLNVSGIDGGVEGYLAGKLPPSYEPYKTVGGCICRVNELIWGLFRFQSYYLRLVVAGELPDPFREWMNMVKSELPIQLFSLKYPSSYEDLSILDEYLPAVFTGRAELVAGGGEGSTLYLYRRW
jgi:hypothetical protein